MPPKITDTVAWQQAELLMQPAFIRIIDHIREQLDHSAWQGTYRDTLIWPDGTTEDKASINHLQQMESVSAAQAAQLEANTHLPTPYPVYQLCLQHQDQQVNFDLWELCYQVCFRNYSPSLDKSVSQTVKIDTSLIDETGDVAWQRLDTKAGELVEQLFANLPVI